MSTNWYYVENNERVGPITEESFIELINEKSITLDTYVWKKGLDNWVQAKNLDELTLIFEGDSNFSVDNSASEFNNEALEESSVLEEEKEQIHFDWDSVDHDDQIFIIKIGEDRGSDEREYGPYSIKMIFKLLEQKRVNFLTQIFAPGMSEWMLLGEIEVFKDKLQGQEQTVERRKSKRCPISARVFMLDGEGFFQGVCRDISIGGAQVLVANFTGKIGDQVRVNMHFEDGSFAFTASGKVTRILDNVGGFAMRYVELSSQAISMINSYIEKYDN